MAINNLDISMMMKTNFYIYCGPDTVLSNFTKFTCLIITRIISYIGKLRHHFICATK